MKLQNKSGLRFHFKVWLDGEDEPIDIVTIPFDTVRYERYSKKPFAESAGSAEMLTWLAYTAAHRMKLTTDQKFDTWAAKVIDLELIEDDEDEDGEPDPTQTEG